MLKLKGCITVLTIHFKQKLIFEIRFSVVEATLPDLAETSLLPLFVFLVDFPDIKTVIFETYQSFDVPSIQHLHLSTQAFTFYPTLCQTVKCHKATSPRNKWLLLAFLT